MFSGGMSAWHWAIVIVVVLLLFGSKKLPDAARGLGRSMRIFKSEMREMQNESKDAKARDAVAEPAPPAIGVSDPVAGTATPPIPEPAVTPDAERRSA